ncbi:MAG: efflux transporter periplasmic adaptor subunit, partial [Selenomonadaceae bacterium]
MSLPKITLKKWHVVVIAVAVVAFLGWRIASSILSKPADERVAPVVRTMTVGASATNDTVTYPGEVRGKYESKLAFQVAGKII